MYGNDTNKIIEEILIYFSIIIKGLAQSMKDDNFVFDNVSGIHYICNKISLSRRGLCIDSPRWIKNTKATIDLKSDDNNCFQY